MKQEINKFAEKWSLYQLQLWFFYSNNCFKSIVFLVSVEEIEMMEYELFLLRKQFYS